MIKKIIDWYIEYKKVKKIRYLRKEMYYFGCNVLDLSDNEMEVLIMRGIGILHKAACENGITINEAIIRLSRIAEIIKKNETFKL